MKNLEILSLIVLGTIITIFMFVIKIVISVFLCFILTSFILFFLPYIKVKKQE
jgi:uncharacterized membrane protein YcaP (DUF421 family)